MQDAGVDQLIALFDLDGKMRKAVDAALVGAVENFPVDEAPIAGQADAAGANAPQRKADLAGLGATVEEVVHSGSL